MKNRFAYLTESILPTFIPNVLANGFLKLTFCAYRPWIRDARIEPFGDSKVAATGYSFPSGHSTEATIYYGSAGWWFRKKNKIIAGLFFAMIFLTMFSRNYLGVHTPQDVVIGFLSTVLMLFLGGRIEDWSDAVLISAIKLS